MDPGKDKEGWGSKMASGRGPLISAYCSAIRFDGTVLVINIHELRTGWPNRTEVMIRLGRRCRTRCSCAYCWRGCLLINAAAEEIGVPWIPVGLDEDAL